MLSESERSLTISLDLQTVSGCLELASLYGVDPQSDRAENVISSILRSLILSLIEEQVLSPANDDKELVEKLARHFPDLAEEAEAQSSELAEIEQNLRGGSEKETPRDPLAFLENEEEEEPELEEISFSSLPADDPLVELAAGDERKEKALCRVYARLPREKRGTDQASELLKLELGEE